MNCSDIKGDSAVSEPCDHLYRRRSLPPNRARTEVGGLIHKHITLFRRTTGSDSVYKYGKFFRRPDPTPVVYAAGRNGGYIRSNTGTVPSVCNEPVMGSHALGSSHRHSGILHGVRTLYGQMAEGNSPVLTCIKMIGASVCYVSLLLFLQQFVRSRRSLSLRLLLTFSCSLHGFLRDQTDRLPPLTDITVLLNDLWAFWRSMNIVDLQNDESGSADLLTAATNGSQMRIYDGIPQTTLKTVKLQTVRLPWLADTEQQCRQLQEIRTCRTSELRQPFWCNNLSATSFTLTPQTPGVFVVFISGRPFSASASGVVASDGRRRDNIAAERRPIPDQERYPRSQPLCSTYKVGASWLFLFLVDAREHIACPIPADAGVFVMVEISG